MTNEANKVGIGYDEGGVVIKIGNERPVASLDAHTGKLVITSQNDIQSVSLRASLNSALSTMEEEKKREDGSSGFESTSSSNEGGSMMMGSYGGGRGRQNGNNKNGSNKETDLDGEHIPLNLRDMGACEIFPQNIKHNSNGHFITVMGDGQYIIYTSQALRNKGFGNALDFVWSQFETGDYAVRESISKVRIYKNFTESTQLKLPISAEEIFGGGCVGVRGADSVVFYDWDTGSLVRKIDAIVKNVYWSENGDLVLLACEDTYFVLAFDIDGVMNAVASGENVTDDGVEGSFDLLHEMNDSVKTGVWVGDCFLYTTGNGKLNYFVGGEILNLCHLDRRLYLLGYLPKDNRVFLIDRQKQVISYYLSQSVLEFQTCVVRRDFENANAMIPSIPESEHISVAKFLESQGLLREALQVTPDQDHKFDLALELGELETAHSLLLGSSSNLGEDGSEEEKEAIAEYEDEGDSMEKQLRWKGLGDLALKMGDIDLATQCAKNSHDWSGLMLIYSSFGNADEMRKLGGWAEEDGRENVAFLAYFLTGQVERCVDLLLSSGRFPEAAFFSRTYLPSSVTHVLSLWKEDLSKVSDDAAEMLGDPILQPDLFPDFDIALQVEDLFKTQRDVFVPSSCYPQAKNDLDLNLIALVKNKSLSPTRQQQPQPSNTSNEESLMNGDIANEEEDGRSLVVEETSNGLAISEDDEKQKTPTKPISPTKTEEEDEEEEDENLIKDDIDEVFGSPPPKSTTSDDQQEPSSTKKSNNNSTKEQLTTLPTKTKTEEKQQEQETNHDEEEDDELNLDDEEGW